MRKTEREHVAALKSIDYELFEREMLTRKFSAFSDRGYTHVSRSSPKLRIKAKEKGAEPPLKVSVLTTFVGYTPRRGDAIGAAVGDQLAHVLTGMRDSDQRR